MFMNACVCACVRACMRVCVCVPEHTCILLGYWKLQETNTVEKHERDTVHMHSTS